MTSMPMAAAFFPASPFRAMRPKRMARILSRAAQAMTAALAAARRLFQRPCDMLPPGSSPFTSSFSACYPPAGLRVRWFFCRCFALVLQGGRQRLCFVLGMDLQEIVIAKVAAIYSTELDLTRPENIANRVGSNSPLAGLVDDLTARTNVAPGNKISADVVTMNSVVCAVDDTGVEQEWMLVYPKEVNVVSAKLLVLSPMGTVLLGAHVGKSVKYSASNGAQCPLRIDRVVFQPEAVGQHTL